MILNNIDPKSERQLTSVLTVQTATHIICHEYQLDVFQAYLHLKEQVEIVEVRST